jgi:hypothetical protein
MGKIVIAGLEFPDDCPDNCPDKHYMDNFDQGNICIRCPIFNCIDVMGERLIEPEHYNKEEAIAWHQWFAINDCLEGEQ